MKNKCLICAYSVIDGLPLCPVCINGLHFITGKTCRICGAGLVSEDELCLKCRKEKFNFVRNKSLFYYFGNVPLLIRNLKKNRDRTVVSYFAGLIASSLFNHEEKDYIIVPVPARPENIKKRGYDQMELIAGVIKKKFGLPFSYCLKRTGGKSQKTLGMEERKKNIEGTVNYKRNGIIRFPVLVDDVFTTGSTLNECAAILLENGAEKVECITIAKD